MTTPTMGNGPDRTSPPGWYTRPNDGEQHYWDGQQWASASPAMAFSPVSTPSEEELIARQLKQGAWWRFTFAVAIGAIVAVIVLNSTTDTVLWWGGYIVAGSLAWGAFKRLQLAGEITGRGVSAGSWLVLMSGVGLVALLGVQAATYWTTPTSPSSPTTDEIVGSCWADSQGDMVAPVDCGSSTAKYRVTSTPSSAKSCSSEYIEMDNGAIACITLR